MTSHGKEICRQLKGIRRKIAEENDIKLEIPECTFEGECRGTCPRCEAEVKYLERELSRRIAAGKVAAVAGIAAATLSLTSCNSCSQHDNDVVEITDEGICATTGEIMPDTPPNIYDEWDIVTSPDGSRLLIERDGEPLNWDKSDLDNCIKATEDKKASDEETIHIVCDQDPQFPGGLEAMEKYIKTNLRYPPEARKAHISGKVFLSFVVEKDGTLSDIKILRDIGEGCGKEAVRLVESMPRWKPGKVDGKKVRTQFNLPITFTNLVNSE